MENFKHIGEAMEKFNEIKDILVSIVVPVYNAEKKLSYCIKSILKQTHKNIEIICVDDDSRDSSGIICQQFLKRDNRIKYYKKENGGPSSARNYGINFCHGEYLLFIDSDDTINENMVETMLKKIVYDNSDFIICGYFFYQNENFYYKQIGKDYSGNQKHFIKQEFERLYRDFLINAPWNKMIKLSFLIENQIHFNEQFDFLEDLIFSLTLIENAKKISVINQALYNYHYLRPGALTTKYHENTNEAILIIGDIFKKSFFPILDNKPYFCADLIHKSLVFLKSVRINPKMTISEKKEKTANLLLNPKFKYYLEHAKSDRLKLNIKILILKLIIKLKFFWNI